MRQILLAVILAVAALTNPGVVFGDSGTGSGWGRIKEVYVDAEGSVLRLQFSGDIVNPGGCEGADFYVRELDDSIASDRFLRIVMAAHLARRKVKFWIDGCSQAQWWGKTRPQIYDIYISD